METKGHTTKKRIVVIDDHTSIRTMLQIILGSNPDYEIAGGTSSGADAVALCTELKPDVVVLDLSLPGMNGMEVLRRLRVTHSSIRIVLYSGTSSRELVLEALKQRPHGYVEKGDALDSLLKAIQVVAVGGTYFTPFASNLLAQLQGPGRTTPRLTEREREVLQLVAEGLTNKAIADRLTVSVKTVENHRAHLMDKLKLHDTAALTRYAVRHGLVSVE